MTAVLEQPAGISALGRLQQILDLIADAGLVPVLVLDDTDHWLSTPGLGDPAPSRAQFFGPILRTVAEDLGAAAAVIPVHTTYLDDAAYRASADFLETKISLPALPDARSLHEILGARARLAVHEPGLPGMNSITPAAVGMLFQHYTAASGGIRGILRVAHDALAYACDNGDLVIDVAHVKLALTQ